MTTEFLKSLGLTEEQIQKIHAENGKDIKREQDKAADVQTKLTAANEQIKTMSDTIKAAEGKDATISELQKKVADYDAAESKRKAAETEASRVAAVRARFDPLKGKNKYINQATEDWMFSEFDKALQDKGNAGKSDADIYAAITKDQNVFMNPQGSFHIPPMGAGGTGTDETKYVTQKYKGNPFFAG